MKISIKNLKSINNLNFELPKSPGVFVITATNGVGKTSLLNVISFLFDSSALLKSFISGEGKFDDFKKSEIIFTDDANEEVTYKFSGSIWHATRKKIKYQTSQMYSRGVLLKLDTERTAPKTDNLKNQNVKPCVFANEVAEILENEDFARLATVTIKGRRSAFVCGSRTERYFSSGEFAVVQIIKKIYDAATNSVILIDEAEISLHPTTQLRLLDFLLRISAQKQIIVFVSTHSQTIIKNTDNKNLYFLEKDGAKINLINPCFPSYALQAISPIEDYFSERIFLFEDNEAIIYFTELKKIKREQQKKQLSHICIPIGGWFQLATFTENAIKYLTKSPSQKFIALFDADVKKTDLISHKSYNSFKNNFIHLQLTPEVSVIKWLSKSSAPLIKINTYFAQNIQKNSLTSLTKIKADANSDSLKKSWREFLEEYSVYTSISIDEVKKAVYSEWIRESVSDVAAGEFFGKIF